MADWRITERRREVKEAILATPARRTIFENQVSTCEGHACAVPHVCAGRQEVNEVLFTRRIFQAMPVRHQLLFFHPFNCSLCCTRFHQRHGHSAAYRDHWLGRVWAIYGQDEVRAWMATLPLRVEHLGRIAGVR